MSTSSEDFELIFLAIAKRSIYDEAINQIERAITEQHESPYSKINEVEAIIKAARECESILYPLEEPEFGEVKRVLERR